MPFIPLLWIGGGLVAAKLLGEAGEAAQGAAKLAKWGAVAGGVYVTYRALQAAGKVR